MDSNDYRKLRNSIDVVGNVLTQLGILIQFTCECVEEEQLDIFGYSILSDVHNILLDTAEQTRGNRHQLMEAARQQVVENVNLTVLEDDDGECLDERQEGQDEENGW